MRLPMPGLAMPAAFGLLIQERKVAMTARSLPQVAPAPPAALAGKRLRAPEQSGKWRFG